MTPSALRAAWTAAVAGGVVRVRFTGRAEGDLAVTGPEAALRERRAAVVDVPWTWLRQVHGAAVVVVDVPGAHAGATADAAVTTVPGAALAVHTADCAPIALVSADGVIAAVHAGWRGLEAGVVAAAAGAMRGLGAGRIEALVGPCIGPECYEFGAGELDRLAARFGPTVRARTTAGRPALDLPAAVRVALAEVDVVVRGQAGQAPACTACRADECFSHRARGEGERQALVMWLEASDR
ncbi:MAG: laccase domain-containing protein [Acidimicrobiales bacterium]|nr:laccase domain-containing protein [Acidimicrobiales bacterium]